MVLMLKESEVAEVLDMDDGLRIVEESFRQHGGGEVDLPPRLAVKLGGEAGAFRVMCASIPGLSAFGLKTLTGIPGRRSPDEVYFCILLFDGDSGGLRCVMPAGRITPIRTGAAGGVGVKYLAREDARRLAVFGSGVQARAQVEAIRRVRQLDSVVVHDVVAELADAFVADLESSGLRAEIADAARDAVRGADIVVCATTAKEAFLFGDWLEEGTHVNAIGANTPAKRELDPTAFARGRIVCDYRNQVLIEAGDLLQAIEQGAVREEDVEAELGQIVAGDQPGRTSDAEITIFKSVGAAFQDIGAATWVYEEAGRRGLGVELDMTG